MQAPTHTAAHVSPSFWFRILPGFRMDPDARPLLVIECQPWQWRDDVQQHLNAEYAWPTGESVSDIVQFGVPHDGAPDFILRAFLSDAAHAFCHTA